MKEITLAKIIVDWLKTNGWEVYQEVHINCCYSQSTPDIVAVKGEDYWIIECKTSASKQLLSQAIADCHHAKLVSVAIPIGCRYKGRSDFYTKCTESGVGILLWDIGGRCIKEHIKPNTELSQKNNCGHWDCYHISKFLHESQKHYCPAGSKSGRWSLFKDAQDAVRNYILAHPECTIKEILDNVETEYVRVRARSSWYAALHVWILPKLAKEGIILKPKTGKAKEIAETPTQLELPL